MRDYIVLSIINGKFAKFVGPVNFNDASGCRDDLNAKDESNQAIVVQSHKMDQAIELNNARLLKAKGKAA